MRAMTPTLTAETRFRKLVHEYQYNPKEDFVMTLREQLDGIIGIAASLDTSTDSGRDQRALNEAKERFLFEVEKYKLFSGLVLNHFCDYTPRELDCFDYEDMAHDSGLIRREPYDPGKHDEIYDVEPGEQIWILTENGMRARQTALNHLAVLPSSLRNLEEREEEREVENACHIVEQCKSCYDAAQLCIECGACARCHQTAERRECGLENPPGLADRV